MNDALRFLFAGAAAAALLGCGNSYDGGNMGGTSSAAIQAALVPVIAVDASGEVLREDPEGTTSDRLTSEIEIFSGDFSAVGIDAPDGFGDESVTIRVRRAGVEVYSTIMGFSEDRRVGGVGDITFEIDVRGVAVPGLQAGDDVDVTVNGVALLSGRFDVV